MSVEATRAVWRYSPAKGSQMLVALAIADEANSYGIEDKADLEVLAYKTRLHRSQVIRIVKVLEARGLLEIERGRGAGQKNTYRLTGIGLDDERSQDATFETSQDATPRAPRKVAKKVAKKVASVRLPEELLKASKALPPSPTEVGAQSINPRTRGDSLRQLGRSPRQLGKVASAREQQLRMARSIGANIAGIFDTPAEVRDEVLATMRLAPAESLSADVLDAAEEAWRARRAEVSV